MKTKEVVVKLKNEQFTITVSGKEEHLKLISKKMKKIRFYCLGSEFKVLTSYLIPLLKELLEKDHFLIQEEHFTKDSAGKSFLILEGGNYFFVLNNNELRVPLTLPKWDILKNFNEMAKYCNTVSHKVEKTRIFI